MIPIVSIPIETGKEKGEAFSVCDEALMDPRILWPFLHPNGKGRLGKPTSQPD